MRANQTIRHFAAYIRKLPHLTNREKDILVKRISSQTLQQVGDDYDLTAERIRQIEEEAIKKIKSKAFQQILFEKLRSK